MTPRAPCAKRGVMRGGTAARALPLGFASLLAFPASVTQAQAPITATPLGPPSQQQISPSSPGQSLYPPAPRSQGADVWVRQPGAKLQALDKINARHAALTLRAGETVQFESLSITLRNCFTRPADQPADAAAFITVTDSRPGWDGFNGWILRSTPAMSMIEHPIYDLRIAGCES